MKKLLFILIILPEFIFANMGIMGRPAVSTGDLYIEAENSLRVIEETISYELDPGAREADVRVNYKISNDGGVPFNGSFFFIASETGKYNPERRMAGTFSVMINGAVREYEPVSKKIEGEKLSSGGNRAYTGALFSVDLEPAEKCEIEVRYRQAAGFSRNSGGLTAAAASRYRNLLSAKSGSLATFSYLIYPIKSFGKGVDRITIRVKYPLRDPDGYPVEDFYSSIPLPVKSSDKESIILEQTFDTIPADYLDLSFDVIYYNRFGISLTPQYIYSNTLENTWALSLSFDYIIKHSIVSAGAVYNFDDRFHLYQELKFFPQKYVYYTGSCIDYRYFFGIVEQIKP
jgi:hypothetical protein